MARRHKKITKRGKIKARPRQNLPPTQPTVPQILARTPAEPSTLNSSTDIPPGPYYTAALVTCFFQVAIGGYVFAFHSDIFSRMPDGWRTAIGLASSAATGVGVSHAILMVRAYAAKANAADRTQLNRRAIFRTLTWLTFANIVLMVFPLLYVLPVAAYLSNIITVRLPALGHEATRRIVSFLVLALAAVGGAVSTYFVNNWVSILSGVVGNFATDLLKKIGARALRKTPGAASQQYVAPKFNQAKSVGVAQPTPTKVPTRRL